MEFINPEIGLNWPKDSLAKHGHRNNPKTNRKGRLCIRVQNVEVANGQTMFEDPLYCLRDFAISRHKIQNHSPLKFGNTALCLYMFMPHITTHYPNVLAVQVPSKSIAKAQSLDILSTTRNKKNRGPTGLPSHGSRNFHPRRPPSPTAGPPVPDVTTGTCARRLQRPPDLRPRLPRKSASRRAQRANSRGRRLRDGFDLQLTFSKRVFPCPKKHETVWFIWGATSC